MQKHLKPSYSYDAAKFCGTFGTFMQRNPNLPFPNIDGSTQQEIVTLIKAARIKKRQSNHLLEVAKRAVEIAIEQDEAAGIAYIQEHTKSYAL